MPKSKLTVPSLVLEGGLSMSFFSTFKAKVRAMCLLLGALLVAFVVSGLCDAERL